MDFIKMHGLGNDFVILDGRKGPLILSAEQIVKICDRHFGVGCDQLVTLESSDSADVKVRFYNNDGSESGACGNASRCVADIIMNGGDVDKCTLEVAGKRLECWRADDGQISVDMGCPQLKWDQIPLSQQADTLYLQIGQDQPDFDLGDGAAVSMGNPHLTFFVNGLEDNLVDKLGAFYEQHALFPENCNVSFVDKLSDSQLAQITYERGSGRTLACGSAACASAVNAMRRGIIGERSVTLNLDGGQIHIEWRESDDHVIMTGPVAYVFDGSWST